MPNKNSGRAQASIDMLIAYGIAILIIAVAIYTLLNLGALNSRLVPGYCNSASSFGCSGYSLSTNGLLTLVITQSTGSTINITGVACAASANSLGTLGPAYGNANVKSYSSAPYYYPNNQLKNGLLVYPSNQTRLVVPCYKNSGIAKGTLGSSYSGQVWINYTIPSLPGHNIQQIISLSTEYTATGASITTSTSSTSTIVTSTSSTSTATSSSSTSTSTSSTSTSGSTASTSTGSTTIEYTFGGVNTSSGTDTSSLTLGPNYDYYFCGSSWTQYNGLNNSKSWTQDAGGYDVSVGHQSSNICSITIPPDSLDQISLMGFGINGTSYTVAAQGAWSPQAYPGYSFNYNVANSSQVIVIMITDFQVSTANWNGSGCSVLTDQGVNEDTEAWTLLIVCTGEAPGTYTVNVGTSAPYPFVSQAYAVYAINPGIPTTSTSSTSTSSTSTSSTSTSTSSTSTSTTSTSTASTTSASTTTVLYTYTGTSSASASTLSAMLASGYNYYFCGSDFAYTSGPSFSWTSDQYASGDYYSVGHQSSNTCTLTQSSAGYASVAGIGIDASSYSILSHGGFTGTPFSFTYTPGSSIQYSFIILTSIYPATVTLPSGCTALGSYYSSYYETYLAECTGQSGLQTVSGSAVEMGSTWGGYVVYEASSSGGSTSTSTSTATSTTSTSSTSTSTGSSVSSTILYTASGNTGDSTSISDTLASGYSYYFCALSVAYASPTYTWTSDETTTYESIGHQSSNVCTGTQSNTYYLSIAGVGITAPSYTLRTTGAPNSGPFTISYTVGDSSQFSVIMISTVAPMTVTLPSGCTAVENRIGADSLYNSYAAVCSGQSTGTQTVTVSASAYYTGGQAYAVYSTG